MAESVKRVCSVCDICKRARSPAERRRNAVVNRVRPRNKKHRKEDVVNRRHGRDPDDVGGGRDLEHAKSAVVARSEGTQDTGGDDSRDDYSTRIYAGSF